MKAKSNCNLKSRPLTKFTDFETKCFLFPLCRLQKDDMIMLSAYPERGICKHNAHKARMDMHIIQHR